MSPAEIIRVQNHFGGQTFMYLPESEIKFFQWLKENDVAVWNDLWQSEEAPYVIAMSFLGHFTSGGNGFPICDLVETDNYYFTEKHIRKPEGIDVLQKVIQKLTDHKSLPVAEALLYEAYCSPIDIWHFAYRHHIPLPLAKKAVDELDRAGLLAHLIKREDLIDYIDF